MNFETLQTRLKDVIDNNKMSSFQILIVVICFIMNMNDGIDVSVVSFSSIEIIQEWHLSKSEMGYIFSAGLAGMTAGCFLLAPLGDKIGRRKVFLIALCFITSGMLLSSQVTAYWQLLILRCITGFGIGGILANMTAVASEFSNNKRRDFSVGAVQAGWPIGAIFTGFFCAWAIPHYGWRVAFLAAGIISLLMLISVYFFMTDSLDFLSKRQPENALRQINIILKKIRQPELNELPISSSTLNRVPLSALFSPEYKISTLKLWLGMFFGFLTLYTLLSWVPTIAKDSGMPFVMATNVGNALNLGGFIGSMCIGIISARIGLRKYMLSFMLISFCIMVTYGNIKLSYAIVFVLVFLSGFFVQGGFNSFYPIASRVYPTEMRTTGIGWASGVGRFGAILGPAIFGFLSDKGFTVASLFILFSLPLLVAGYAAFTIPSKNLK